MILDYRGLTIHPVTPSSLSKYLDPFKASFPRFKTSVEYIDWLYFQNPNGPAVDFDAFDGELLVAHYVCIPIWVDGYQKPSLLALNTAKHPKYQDRGLLKVLANNTYEKYENEFSCVVGIDSAQAIKPLTKHLGFEHIGDLELRFGVLNSSSRGRRTYSSDDARWRDNCPKRSLITRLYRGHTIKLTHRLYRLCPVSALCPLRGEESQSPKLLTLMGRLGVTLDWRKNIKPKALLPNRLKPSPLSFVFRPLSESNSSGLVA